MKRWRMMGGEGLCGRGCVAAHDFEAAVSSVFKAFLQTKFRVPCSVSPQAWDIFFPKKEVRESVASQLLDQCINPCSG